MFTALKKTYYAAGAAMTLGLMGITSTSAQAQGAGGSTFSDIAENVNTSIESLPGLITGVSYLFGTLLGVLGIMKIKDHVENPTQTALKDGAIRLGAGGALFALPVMYDAMFNTVDGGLGGNVNAAQLNKVQFNVN